MDAGNAHLRAGDAEREETIAGLRRAAEEGRLAAEELDLRAARARQARTRGELEVLLADLVGPANRTNPGMLVAPGYRPDDQLMLSAGFSGEKRTGVWTVPPFLRAHALADDVRLDCRHAQTVAPVIDLEVLPGAGAVVLVLPPGWAVNTDRLTKGLGTITVKVPTVPDPGCPVFAVRGSVGIGTFKARGPNRWERWREHRRELRGG